MIGLDTNVLVRFLVQDDPEQGRAAQRLIETCTEESPGFISREVLVELVWVMERAYKLPRGAVADALDGLLGAAELIVEDADRAGRAALYYREETFDFADLMIVSVAMAKSCNALYTFDKKASRIPGARPLQ